VGSTTAPRIAELAVACPKAGKHPPMSIKQIRIQILFFRIRFVFLLEKSPSRVQVSKVAHDLLLLPLWKAIHIP
jgi:hypothetical protein